VTVEDLLAADREAAQPTAGFIHDCGVRTVCDGPLHRLTHSDDHAVSNDGYSVRPPSMNSVCPVMYAASSEQRNAVTAAISSDVPARRIGMCDSTILRLTGSSIHARLIGVTVAPGPIPFTRIPRCAYSSASVRVRFCIPPLLTE